MHSATRFLHALIFIVCLTLIVSKMLGFVEISTWSWWVVTTPLVSQICTWLVGFGAAQFMPSKKSRRR